MKQSQRLRVIVSPVGDTGQVTFYTTAREVENASRCVRETFAELVKTRSAMNNTIGIMNSKDGWDVQIDLV